MASALHSSNKLLASLPRDEYEEIGASLRPVSIRSGVSLCRYAHSIHDVYFPGDGAFSLERISDNGQAIEIAIVGSEGLIGAEVFYGAAESSVDCRPLMSDVAVHAMNAEVFRSHVERRTALYNVVVRYQQALMTQIVQMTACTALHTPEQRTCRWLLMVHDRAMNEVIPINHMRLAQMLGIDGRAVAARTARLLAARGAIVLRRRGVVIENRANIEAASCECYQRMKQSFQRLMPEIGALSADSVDSESARLNSARITS